MSGYRYHLLLERNPRVFTQTRMGLRLDISGTLASAGIEVHDSEYQDFYDTLLDERSDPHNISYLEQWVRDTELSINHRT